MKIISFTSGIVTIILNRLGDIGLLLIIYLISCLSCHNVNVFLIRLNHFQLNYNIYIFL